MVRVVARFSSLYALLAILLLKVNIARLLCRATLSIAGLLAIGAIDMARAQNIAVSKDLCSSAGCVSQSQSALPSVSPNTPVSYTISRIRCPSKARGDQNGVFVSGQYSQVYTFLLDLDRGHLCASDRIAICEGHAPLLTNANT
jgi:hypothetical protein